MGTVSARFYLLYLFGFLNHTSLQCHFQNNCRWSDTFVTGTKTNKNTETVIKTTMRKCHSLSIYSFQDTFTGMPYKLNLLKFKDIKHQNIYLFSMALLFLFTLALALAVLHVQMQNNKKIYSLNV